MPSFCSRHPAFLPRFALSFTAWRTALPMCLAVCLAMYLAMCLAMCLSTTVAAGEATTAEPPSAYDPARPPNQFLVFDTVAVHTEDGQMLTVPGNGHKPTFTRAQRIPKDWTAPVDFAGGSYRIRYEILEKPNTRRVHFCVVLSTPLNAKDKADMPSHPGSDWFTTAGVVLEEEPMKKGFAKTYQGKQGWNWKNPFGRIWEDTYRMGSSQYGPSSVFPLKVRIQMTVIAKGFTYHPYGNLADLDFRNLKTFISGAKLIGQGRLGPAWKLAQELSSSKKPEMADEAQWVVRGLEAYAVTRMREIDTYAAEEPDCASDELQALAAEFTDSAPGDRLLIAAQKLENDDKTQRARKARVLWNKILAEANTIVITEKAGTERWDTFVPMPPAYQKQYAKSLARIEAGTAEMLSIYTSRNWERMAKALLHNLGISDK